MSFSAIAQYSLAKSRHRLTDHDADPRPAKPTIVLVHGAFADASSWSEVIPKLQHDGYTVIAVQNTLTSLVTTSRRRNA